MRGDPLTLATLQTMREAGGEASLNNMVPYITSKLSRFIRTSAARRMLTQSDAHDFDESIALRRVILVKLDAHSLGPEAAALIARQIVHRVSQACLRRGTSASNPAHFLYADEFHHFATERFAMLLAEARKYRLGLVLAHQYTSQLLRDCATVLNAVLGNVGTLVAFRVGSRDAELLEPSYGSRATADDVSELRNHSALVRVSGRADDAPFTLFTDAAAPGDPERAAQVALLARMKHTVATPWSTGRSRPPCGRCRAPTASERRRTQVPGSSLPRSHYRLPILRLARLAVDERVRGTGVGASLLRAVLGLAVTMAQDYGSVGAVVDAKPDAVAFYAKLGFTPLEVEAGQLGARPEPLPTFVPLGALAQR